MYQNDNFILKKTLGVVGIHTIKYNVASVREIIFTPYFCKTSS